MELVTILATANAVLLLLTALLLVGTGRDQPAEPREPDEPVPHATSEACEAVLNDLTAELGALRAEVSKLSLTCRRTARVETESGNYVAAERLAQSGCSVEEIVQSCQLPEAEARLLIRWQSVNSHMTQAKAAPITADKH